MKIEYAKPYITEEDIEYVSHVLRTQTKLTDGPQCELFQNNFNKFIKHGHSLAVNSCTSALVLSLMSIGVRDSYVLVTNFSHVATANCIKLAGGRPIFVDSDEEGMLDVKKLEEQLSVLEFNNFLWEVKALIVVNMDGIKHPHMNKIVEITKKYNLFLIEDCALSLGVRTKEADFSCYSFYPAKIITTAEGGMLVCKDKEYFDRSKKLRTFGVVKPKNNPTMYNMEELGTNFRMSEINAALGVSQLKRVNDYIMDRWQNYIELYKNIPISTVFKIINHSKSEGSIYSLRLVCKSKTLRNKLAKFLKKKEIGYSIYYPQPISQTTYYSRIYVFSTSQYKEAQKLCDTSINLPIGSHIGQEEGDYMIKALTEFVR